MVNYPECTIENLALIFQLVIILLSLSFSSATIIRIIRQKLYNNPFTFLILVIQSCYATMAIIDLLTKATALSNAYIVWCQVVGPLIYGAIVVLFYIIQSSFMLMELFVLMIYFTLSRKKYGPLNNNIKLITLSFVIGAICINCVGIPYYGVGFCQSCGFRERGTKGYQQFVAFVVNVDYYLPMLLVIPSLYLFYKLYRLKQIGQFDQKQSLAFKVLWIPFLNFIVLSVSSISNYLQKMPPIGYVFVFDSIYYVSIINFIFYNCFVNFFKLGENNVPPLCCQCNCFKNEEQGLFQSELYPYHTRSNSM